MSRWLELPGHVTENPGDLPKGFRAAGVAAGIKRLLELQQPDGGWGWIGSSETHEMMTPYALYGLLRAEDSGYEIGSADAVERGLGRLEGFIGAMDESKAADRIYCMYVYSLRRPLRDEWWAWIGDLLEKELTIGLPGLPNVIEHRVTYHVSTAHEMGIFEASTGYLPRDFALALYFDPATGKESRAGRQGEQSLPVILATPDRRHAMGVYSPDLPQVYPFASGREKKGPRVLGYGYFSFPDVVKWNCVYRVKSVKPGAYSYRCLIPVGSVEEVKDAIRRLHVDKAAVPRKPGRRS